ncbi:MAG TPA: T9SS type A sorting domain-containing protein, partial [Candidatus Kapabacteria bacterium]|nr:T9SS type A sorting domain-containing protein [Candidatus Kapabacteria bacterium]
VEQTSDGGYIVAGASNSSNQDVTGNHGGYDYWIIKLDANGNIQWQKSLGGSGWEVAFSIQQTIDGGYIVAGSSGSNDGNVTNNHGGADFWIVKLNSTGTIEWEKSLGGSKDEEAYMILQTRDGNYIFTGYSSSNDGDIKKNQGNEDFCIIKLDSKGNIVWEQTYGGSDDETSNSIKQTADGGYIAVGYTETMDDGDVKGVHGQDDYWVVKLSPPFNPPLINSSKMQILPDMTCGAQENATVWVRNVGSGVLVIDSAKFNNPVFSLLLPISFPDSIAPGDSMSFILRASPASVGTYSAILDIPCNDTVHNPWQISFTVNVKAANISVPQTLSEIICPNAPVVLTFPVTNNDASTHVLTFTDSNCMISKTTATLAGGATDTIAATFAGGAAGTYTCIVHVTDDCGGNHDVTLTINVQELPPLSLALVPDAAPVKVGGEVKLYLTATPPSSVTGALMFTVANDPEILRFIGVRSLCGANAQSTPRSTMITLSGCPALTSDTIAELDYEALAGPTLTTSTQIITAATTNACETVSASGTATLTLLPPSCDIGTIGIEPNTTSLGTIYPNPATAAVTVAYTMVEDAPVRVAIVDGLGRTVQTLVNNYQQHGTYLAEFDAHALPNGIYLVTMQEGLYTGAREILVMK